MENDHTWSMIAMTAMPDHLHALFELGERLPLAKVVARFKAKLSPHLRSLSLGWQTGFFEHRLRPEEELLPVLRYLWLNPVRAGLATPNGSWAGFYCRETEWVWFQEYVHEAVADPEWLVAAGSTLRREQARSHSYTSPLSRPRK
jgi:hypothetical protein